MIALQHPLAFPTHYNSGHYAPYYPSSQQHHQFPTTPVRNHNHIHQLPNPQFQSGRLARARDIIVPSIPLPSAASSVLIESVGFSDSPSPSPIHPSGPNLPRQATYSTTNSTPPTPTKRRSTSPNAKAKRRNSYQGPTQQGFDTPSPYFQQPPLVRAQTLPIPRQVPHRSRTYSNEGDLNNPFAFNTPLPHTPTHNRSPSASSFFAGMEMGERYANSRFQNSPPAKELPKPKFLS